MYDVCSQINNGVNTLDEYVRIGLLFFVHCNVLDGENFGEVQLLRDITMTPEQPGSSSRKLLLVLAGRILLLQEKAGLWSCQVNEGQSEVAQLY